MEAKRRIFLTRTMNYPVHGGHSEADVIRAQAAPTQLLSHSSHVSTLPTSERAQRDLPPSASREIPCPGLPKPSERSRKDNRNGTRSAVKKYSSLEDRCQDDRMSPFKDVRCLKFVEKKVLLCGVPDALYKKYMKSAQN